MIIPILMPVNMSGFTSIKEAISIYLALNIIGGFVIIIRIFQYFYKKNKIKKRQSSLITSDDSFSFFEYVIFDYSGDYKISFANGLYLIIINISALLVIIITWLVSTIQKFI